MNSEEEKDVVITGFGAISNIGLNAEALWSGLDGYRSSEYPPDTKFDPFIHRGFVEFDTAEYIKKRSSLRGMSASQIASTCAAGMALTKAGLRHSADVLETMPLVMACNGNQRQDELDNRIHRELAWHEGPLSEREKILNERLNDMRPTLFLTQLPNLFTANIAMNLGVTGECVTLLGEEEAGVNSVEVACRRIASGQNTIMLVGSAFDGSDKYLHMSYAYSGLLQRKGMAACLNSMSLGSAAAFLVLECKQHAQARGADIFAHIRAMDQCVRAGDEPLLRPTPAESLYALLSRVDARLTSSPLGVLLASADKYYLDMEANIWRDITQQRDGLHMRATSGILGYLREASFITHIAVAIGCLQNARMFRKTPFDLDMGIGADSTEEISKVAVSMIGKHCGEAIAILEAGHG